MIPEALGKNSLTLPRGAECDRCNNAMGKLDETLMLYPHIALALQFLGVPGKNGPRNQIGSVKRITENGGTSIASPGAVLSLQEHQPGKRTVKFEVVASPGFKMARFRRGLHHVALNAVAALHGVDYVMDARFDPMRRYIKAPKNLGPGKVEAWPFAQGETDGPSMPREVLVRHLQQDIVSIQLLHLIFSVDLYNNPGLAAWAAAEGHHFIRAEVTEPWPARMTYVER